MSAEQTDKLALLAKIQGIAGEDLLEARARAEDWTRDLEFRTRTAAVILRDVDAKAKTAAELDAIAEDVRAGKL